MISNTTIFTGCDSAYWKQYGKSFVKSFQHFNVDKEIFIQIFNPDQSDLDELNTLGCNYNATTISTDYINQLVDAHIKIFENNSDEVLRNQLKNGMKFSEKNYGYTTLEEKMQHLITFSVYASHRFIKMSELWNGKNPIAAYDIDTICRGNINIDSMLKNNDSGCLAVKGDRFVVSLVAFRNNSQLLREWASTLQDKFNENKVYGFLDQDTFVNLSNRYNVTRIDRIYCDHTKKSQGSYVITGKGTNKWTDSFKKEMSYWKDQN